MKKNRIAVFASACCPPCVFAIENLCKEGEEIALLVYETSRRKRYSKNEIHSRKTFFRFIKYRLRQLILFREKFSIREFKLLVYKYMTSVYWSCPSIIRHFINIHCDRIPFLRKGSLELVGKKYNIPVEAVDRHSSEKTVKILKDHDIQYVLVYFSNWLLKEPLFSMKETRFVHVHGSWLPYNRGLDSEFYNIFDDRPLANTAFFMDEGLDSGDIILRELIEPKYINGESLIEFLNRFAHEALLLYIKVVKVLREGEFKVEKQDDAPDYLKTSMTFGMLLETEKKLKSHYS